MDKALKIGDKVIKLTVPEGSDVSMEGGKLTVNPNRSLEQQLNVEFQNQGIQWGDAVAWITQKMSITQCPPCKARQRILNQARQLGLVETIKQIKETL